MPSWKVAVFVGWAVLALALFTAPETSLIQYARLGFWLTLGAHVLEFAIFFKTFDKAPGSLGHHFAHTLALGMFHLQEVRRQDGTSENVGTPG